MARSRKITIERDGGCVTFDPPILQAKIGDQIFWKNTDDEAHWPGRTDDDTFFMPNQIAPNSTSSTFSPGRAETLEYVCTLHSGETGTIEVT